MQCHFDEDEYEINEPRNPPCENAEDLKNEEQYGCCRQE